MALHSLSPAAAGSLAEITPVNWPTNPSPVTAAMLTPANVATVTYTGGAFGDDIDTATANSTNGAIVPATQAAKAALPGASPPNAIAGEPDFTISTDITAPRGFIGPMDSYAKTLPAAPTITSLAPNTIAAGTAGPLSVVVTGTNYTPWTSVKVSGVASPNVRYHSATKLTVQLDPKTAVAGVVPFIVVDHGVSTAATNFTYT